MISSDFVEVDPQKKRLRIKLPTSLSDIVDPQGRCSERSFGFGTSRKIGSEAFLTTFEQLDVVLDLMRQTFLYYQE